MTGEDYQTKRSALETKFEEDLDALNRQYVQENAEFKVGDFIYNVTGIIKVEQIHHEGDDFPVVVYYGKRYKKRYGKLVPTKHNQRGRLWGDLKKIKNTKPVHLL